MATRSPRDKAQSSLSSKFTPRPTTASTARAARSSTGRVVMPLQKGSPGRAPPSPNSIKALIRGNPSLEAYKQHAKHAACKDPPWPSRPFIHYQSGSTNQIPIGEDPRTANTVQTKNTFGQRNAQKAEIKTEGRFRNLPHEQESLNGERDKPNLNKTELEPVATEKMWESNTIIIATALEDNKLNGAVSVQEIYVEEKTEVPMQRPRTPASDTQSVKSRPRTPRIGSRPATPGRPTTTPRAGAGSRPATAHGRPRTPGDGPPAPPAQRPAPVSSPAPAHPPQPALDDNNAALVKSDDESLRVMFESRQKMFNQMKKELDVKQQNVLKVYDQLRSLHDRLEQDGATELCLMPQDLVVLNVTDWAAGEIAQWYKETSCVQEVEEVLNNPSPIDEKILKDISARMTEIPASFADLCLQAFTARQDIIDWVKELVTRTENGSGEALDRIAKFNNQGLDLCEALRDLKGRADNVVTTVIELSRRMCHERSALMAAGESLVREIATLRSDFDARMTNMEMNSDSKGLEELRRELDEERKSRAALKEKLVATETQLKSMRTRVTKMDKQLHDADATISALTATVKSLEDQSRQRELQLETRARKLRESLKTGEMASNELLQQRNALQNELQEVKEHLASATSKHKSTVKELSEQVKDLKLALENAQRETHQEIEKRMEVEHALNESLKRAEELKEQIAQLERKLPNPNAPTQREMNLWAELQSTKEALRVTEDEITFCKKEKIRFLETLTKIADTDNKVGMQQKLAAELLSKEELISNMQNEIKELKKSIKYNEQKVIQYERYVDELHSHNSALVEQNESPDGMSYQELHQQIMTLRMNLVEAAQRNEDLTEIIEQKDQEIEKQDKTSKAQARVIKVREELIAMLKNKETEQAHQLAALQKDIEHRMKIVDDVNKQIAAKADEIQELFATLENKQQQIRRLEKIILALEDQQRRAQAQRTRHEEKIAALEHELAAGGNRRKYLFF